MLTPAIKTSIVTACSKCLGKAEGFAVLSSMDTSMAPLGACSMMGLESHSEQRGWNKNSCSEGPLQTPTSRGIYRSEGRAAHMFLCKDGFVPVFPPLYAGPLLFITSQCHSTKAPLLLFEETGDKRLTGVCHSSQSRDVQSRDASCYSQPTKEQLAHKVECAGEWLHCELPHWYPP